MAGEGSAAAPPPHALEVTPESALQFTLTRSPPDRTTNHSADATAARCTMTLRHPGGTSEHLAFKVKTTQPRRYLVRPNQGVVAPNTTETVSILLVEKDKQILLQSYDRLGQSALDHSKDKFLVQSCAVTDEFAKECAAKKVKADASSDSKTAKELAEALTSMWNTAAGSGGSQPIHNKKLHVRHVVPPGEGVSSSSAASGGARPTPPPSALREADKPPLESMTPEQMYAEVSNLRRKYDELVAFSVNLTAERDILNNTLEQTKRDLNREVASRAAIENRGGAPPREASPAAKSGGGVSIFMLFLVSMVVFLAAVKATNSGSVGFLEDLPALGPMLGFGDEGEEGAAAAVPTGGGSGEL